MERFPRRRHRLGPEKNRLIRAAGVRGLPRASLCHRERTNNGIEKRPGSVSAHVSEKKANEPTGSYLVPGRFQLPLCVSLVAPMLLEAASDLSLPLSLSLSLTTWDQETGYQILLLFSIIITLYATARRYVVSQCYYFPLPSLALWPVFGGSKGKAIFRDYARGKAWASLKDVVEGLDLLDMSTQRIYPIILQDLWHKINTLTQTQISSLDCLKYLVTWTNLKLLMVSEFRIFLEEYKYGYEWYLVYTASYDYFLL